MGPRLGRVEYTVTRADQRKSPAGFNGATLRTRGIRRAWVVTPISPNSFNGATLRTRGIRIGLANKRHDTIASMGPRLGRVEYWRAVATHADTMLGFNGATLRTRGIQKAPADSRPYPSDGFNGATLRTRGIRDNGKTGLASY